MKHIEEAMPRQQIIDAANAFRRKSRGNHGAYTPFTMRHINQAVCIVRRQLLIDDETLVLAGFNPVRPAGRRRFDRVERVAA